MLFFSPTEIFVLVEFISYQTYLDITIMRHKSCFSLDLILCRKVINAHLFSFSREYSAI